ncbi:DUF349 domain-containing protein [Saccharicrinis aurantiacus]|uniref:DUF349 domain-containing protein n=1 Tax=Saccharicrinis aurantiacus TaxID=1849719 RepID=UPI002491C896|nr:DUF349 domain-containing protein [Saccharicrinis aurantiacus]
MEANDLSKSGNEEQDLNSVENTENKTPENVSSDTNSETSVEETSKPIESVEETTEETAKVEEEKPELDKVDLSVLSREKLVDRLRYITRNFEVLQIKDEVEDIKSIFYKIYHAELAVLKEKFLESGEPEENFAPPIDHFESEAKALIKDFKAKKSEVAHKIEAEKEANLVAKYEIIEAIKNLLNRQESLNETFHDFRELQQQFHKIGQIPQAKVRDVWDTYNLHVENFYDYVKINKELRDLDLKKNLVLKTELCEKAELLIDETAVVNSFKTLQKYHDRWREIGPVPKELKDELWERFKAATTKINQKHQEYFEGLKVQLAANLEAKTKLCEEVEEIVAGKIESPKQWEEKSKQLIAIQQKWKTIGFAPKKDNNTIYERFRGVCDKFFENKRTFFKDYKNEQSDNYNKKVELCELAEQLKDSTEWRKTSEALIKIQKDWKQIGPVPRRQSDAIWHRFRAACDFFFDNKSKNANKADASQVANLDKKVALIAEVKAFVNKEDNEETFKALQAFQKQFSEIGHVPYKEKDNVNQEFRNEINKHFDSLNMDEYHKNVQKFRNRIENLKNSGNSDDKVYQERHKLQLKLKQLEADITTWENNIGFFSKSKNADSMLKDFQRKIENGKRSIELLKEKIKMLNRID